MNRPCDGASHLLRLGGPFVFVAILSIRILPQNIEIFHQVSAFPFGTIALRSTQHRHSPFISSLSSTSFDEDDDSFVPPLPMNEGGEELLSVPEIQSLTVPQLKQQLRLRGLKLSGRKKELQERLSQFSLGSVGRVWDADSTSGSKIETTSGGKDTNLESSMLEAGQMQRDAGVSTESVLNSEAGRFAEGRDKQLIDVSAYLDEDDKDKTVRSSTNVDREDQDSESIESKSSGPEVWGREARIVDDYEGRRVVVDNLSRTVVEFKGSNQTDVQAFVVASRDALKAYLLGGDKGQNKTSSAEERLRDIQNRREAAARVPLRFEDDEGLDEGDETGLYNKIVDRDFTDWGKFTQTGAQLSASEVQGVLLLSDVYGPFSEDTRFLAEKIAFECQPVVVMVPDMFRGHPWKEQTTTPGKNEQGQTYEQWRSTHTNVRVSVDIRAAAACLRERYGISSITVWGTCYGGGRALEAAAGFFPDDIVHDVDGSVGPPPVDPMVAIAWYPTRYDAKKLFGVKHSGSNMGLDGEKRSVAVMAIFAGKDKIAGATPEDAALLKSLLEEDDRVKDHMVKVFPGQDHGFAHVGASTDKNDEDYLERFVDEEFGGSGRVGMDDSEPEVACLLSTAWMETYSRIFLPTTGPAISDDENETDWSALNMKELSTSNGRHVREEIEDALDNFVEEPLVGKRIDQADESQRDELAELLRTMQNGEDGPYAIKPDDDLTMIYAKLKASDENFQIF